MKISVIGSTKEGHVIDKEEIVRMVGHAAGVCYMSDSFEDLSNEPIEKTKKRFEFILKNGHTSPLDHIYVNLLLENVPKGLAMILNNEKMYTTSEKSARYTKLKPIEEDNDLYQEYVSDEDIELYDKWFNTFTNLIKEEYQEKCPKFFTDSKIEKLAQENARYLISVFTPTTFIHSITIRQLNYIYEMFQCEIKSTDSNEFMTQLKPAMQKFCDIIDNKYGDLIFPQLLEDSDRKSRKLSLIGRMTQVDQHFGHTYSVSYKGSLAQFAQAQRHRTLSYNMTLLDEPEFFVPPILIKSPELIREWVNDCEKQLKVFPQGLLVNINQWGDLDAFISMLKERQCTCAQLEINQQSNLLVKMYYNELKKKNHPRAEELEPYTKGSRCWAGYPCTNPCGFIEGIKGDRLI